MVLPMPKLSHTMTHGRIARWLKAEGERVEVYDIVMEVETDNLVEEAYRLDDFAGRVTLLVESQEEGYVARVLVPQGSEVSVGTPVALVCEEEHEVADLQRQGGGSSALAARNVYEEGGPPVRQLEWQSYLKKGTPRAGCS